MKLNVVLVEPEIPQNTGNIARTCAVTGCSLHLIGPLGFRTDSSSLRHAGLDYWQFLNVSYYKSMDEFFEKNQGNFFFFSTKAKLRYTEANYPDNSFLFFGKESAGLPEKLLYENPKRTVRIPMLDEKRSLNLANSVAIGVYEVLRQWDFPELSCSGALREYDWKDAKDSSPSLYL